MGALTYQVLGDPACLTMQAFRKKGLRLKLLRGFGHRRDMRLMRKGCRLEGPPPCDSGIIGKNRTLI